MAGYKIDGRFIALDGQSMEQDGVSQQHYLRAKVDGATIQRSNDGLKVPAAGIGPTQLDLTATYDFTAGVVKVADPGAEADVAVPKGYVDSRLAGFGHKAEVEAATLAASEMSGFTFTAGEWTGVTADPTFDGVTMADGQKVLVKNGDGDGAYPGNGVFVYGAAADKLTRDALFNDWDEILSGFVFVKGGDTYGGRGYVCSSLPGGTLDSSDITYSQFAAPANVTVGYGLHQNGNNIHVDDLNHGINPVSQGLDLDASEVAGFGLAADGTNAWQLIVDTANIVGTGLEVDGDGLIRLATGAVGDGMSVTDGVISITPDVTSVGDIAPVSVLGNGVGVDVSALDGDHLDVDMTPSNYAPTTTGASEAADVDDLAAHLKGIDNKLGDLSTTEARVERFTLGAGDIGAKKVVLTGIPASYSRVLLMVSGAPAMHYGDAYVVALSGAGPAVEVKWPSLQLDGVLEAGDKLTVVFDTLV